MQVKVRALSEGRFVVKTRLHPDFDQKKENKNGKNRKRNKNCFFLNYCFSILESILL